VAAAAAIGLVAVRWSRRQRTRSREIVAPTPPPFDPVDTAQLEAELERYRQ